MAGLQSTGVNPPDFSMVLAASVHDMKNSVGLLLGSLEEVMADIEVTETSQRDHFLTLQYEAARINTELVQLLSLYRLGQQQPVLHQQQHYVRETLEDQIARNAVLLQMRGINLQLICDERLVWFYDEHLIGSVIHNVLINSLRYARQRLQIVVDVRDGWLMIEVADDGSGFPEVLLAGDKGAGHHDSTHLGLFFAQSMAASHQHRNRRGYVDLFNGAPLGGAVFQLLLP